MSLCAECFLAGNHDGHDYNMFRSQAGGACDCGDQSVMKETGYGSNFLFFILRCFVKIELLLFLN